MGMGKLSLFTFLCRRIDPARRKIRKGCTPSAKERSGDVGTCPLKPGGSKKLNLKMEGNTARDIGPGLSIIMLNRQKKKKRKKTGRGLLWSDTGKLRSC